MSDPRRHSGIELSKTNPVRLQPHDRVHGCFGGQRWLQGSSRTRAMIAAQPSPPRLACLDRNARNRFLTSLFYCDRHVANAARFRLHTYPTPLIPHPSSLAPTLPCPVSCWRHFLRLLGNGVCKRPVSLEDRPRLLGKNILDLHPGWMGI